MTRLIDIADDGGTLLTVNNRLATELRARFDQACHASGHRVWASADILPWDAWLARCYELLVDAGLAEHDLLSPIQERLLWQSIIERDTRGAGLLRPAAAAQSAQASAQLYTDWQLEQDEPVLLIDLDALAEALTPKPTTADGDLGLGLLVGGLAL